MKYDIILKNETEVEIDFILFSKDTQNKYNSKVLSKNKKNIPYEEKGFVGFSEMEFFLNGNLLEKVQVYGGNIIKISKKDFEFHIEISYPDF